MKLNFKRQAGATLMELMMSVAIIAGISIAAMAFYNSTSNANKVQEAVSGLTAMTSVIRNQYSTQGNYEGISADIVMKFGNVPETLLVRNGTTPLNLKHPWNSAGNAVNIAPAQDQSANDSFSITFAKIPSGSCNDFVSKTYRHFNSTKVGSTTVSGVTSITNACGTGNDVDVTFTTR